jgi:hypothetical protein
MTTPYPGFYAVPGSMWPGAIWPGEPLPPPPPVPPGTPAFIPGIPQFQWAAGSPGVQWAAAPREG